MNARYRVILTKRATDDIASIHRFIESRSEQNAPRVVNQILRALETLEMFPNHNVVSTKSKQGPIRSLPVHSYVVYFRITESSKTVHVIRVRHGARRPLKKFE